MKKLAAAMLSVFFVFAFFVSASMPLHAQASALSEAQIQAILSLLQSFGADSSVVSNVNSSLRGEPTTPVPTGGITVTAPNGGEQWEIGQLNTITWTPYGYNPDVNPASQVKAYLVKKSGNSYVNAGEIVPGGKASIHWQGEIIDPATGASTYPKAGKYYIKVTNIYTNATDISDAPFRVMPRAVDVKVNGSDNSLTLNGKERVKLSWEGTGVSNCSIFAEHTYQHFLPVATSGSVKIMVDPSVTPIVGVVCTRTSGEQAHDYIGIVRAWQGSAIQVVTPNGGESISADDQWNITTVISGLKTLSLALYKNDQWLTWLAKDMDATGRSDNFEWTHTQTPFGSMYPELKNGTAAEYKIYATGLKADGTGYVDDKSDSAFSFSARPTQLTVTAKANSEVVTNEQGVVELKWNIQNAPSGASLGIVLTGVPNVNNNEYTLVSNSLLVNTTRVVDLQVYDGTMPTDGTIYWTPSFGSSFVPTNGYIEFRVYGANGIPLYTARIPLRVALATMPYIEVKSITRPILSFSYANLPTTDIQGVFLVSAKTGTNIASVASKGGTGTASIDVSQYSPAGTYFLRVLAIMNNRTITESAMFELPEVSSPTQPAYSLGVGYVSTHQDGYSAGQKIPVAVKASESDGTPGTPEEGYNVQVYLYPEYGNSSIEGLNADYNSSTGYWEATVTAPTDSSRRYKVSSYFYCSREDGVCAKRNTSQVETSFIFGVTDVAPSSTASLTVNGTKEITVNAGDNLHYEWKSANGTSYTSYYTSDKCGNGNPWSVNTASGSLDGSTSLSQAGCKYKITYQVNNSNKNEIATDTIYVTVLPTTASLSANGEKYVRNHAGDSLVYKWSSSGADKFTSYYTSNCGNGNPWAVNTSSGTLEGRTSSDQAGCTYYITYKVTNSATGAVATDTITIEVVDPYIVISSVRRQLAGALSAILPTRTAVPPLAGGVVQSAGMRFTEDLYRGVSGKEVVALQEILSKAGLFAGEATGNYLDQTVEAVKKYQLQKGLSATGYVGPATRAALNSN